ncbi:hypothetical protein [Lentzea sp. NPDC059081]|uniref:hypothetical protein n=1 Tax=Lentzea sp. NPDC059081 TaxID=3346719 RepID=UPI0036CB907B
MFDVLREEVPARHDHHVLRTARDAELAGASLADTSLAGDGASLADTSLAGDGVGEAGSTRIAPPAAQTPHADGANSGVTWTSSALTDHERH